MLFLFYSTLHILGLICVFPLSRKIHVWLLSLTGFIWGLLIWVFCTTISLLLGLQYNWVTMALLLTPVLLAAIGTNIHLKTFNLPIQKWGIILLSISGFSLMAYLVTRKSYVFATSDSFSIIYHAQIAGKTGLVTWVVDQFTEWGLLLPIIQMASQLLPGDYISGYQTLLAGILISVFTINVYQTARIHFRTVLSGILTIMLVLVLISRMFINHVFYIHSNIIAAVLIYFALYFYWHFFKSESMEWLILSTVALIGIGFTRIEGPLYTILFILFASSVKQLKTKQVYILVFPYSITALLWHVYLYFFVSGSGLLERSFILIIISAILGLMLFGLIYEKIPRLISLVPKLIILVLGAGLFLAFILKPQHMLTSITNLIQNLLQVYSWGWSWITAVALLLIMKPNQNHSPGNRFLGYCIAGYILLILLFAFARIPYRLGMTDSANRLMLQIQPILFYYIARIAGKHKELFTTLLSSSKTNQKIQ